MPGNASLKLDNHSHAQRERLAFIDFCLQYHGSVGRSELMSHFGTAVASSTRDFALYRELAQENLVLRHENKRYYRTCSYQPLFSHNPQTALKTLACGFGDGLSVAPGQHSFCEDAPDLIAPSQDVLATLSRAISQALPVRLTYLSLSSGNSERVIVPHSIVNNGQRWHVRGYCRHRNEFRDFVCTRITDSYIENAAVTENERQTADKEWNQQLTLELVPHPNHSHPEAIALDFAMAREGNSPLRQVSIRAARAGYLLRYWNVDCSLDHSLSAHEYHLWLQNSSEMNQSFAPYLKNMMLAPGMQPKRPNLAPKTNSQRSK
ncbi:WYL domain-containing protein [Pseudidiomarina terrestris]|uniref:WYL domain-containing protein n=1 Tax=Pseudidiomarina terrestris TaxID=2820060 RepID=UPI002B058AFB|nr:WYL domain-containing protein [Pseudidiomarina sp. 1APP75-27a]